MSSLNFSRHNGTAWASLSHSAEVAYSERPGQMPEVTSFGSFTQMAGAEGSRMHPKKCHPVQDQAKPRGNAAAVLICKSGDFKGGHLFCKVD